MKAKPKLNFIDKIFLWISFLLCLCLLISYAAPFTNPATLWLVAFFGLAYPFILLANVILVLYWLVRRNVWVLLPVLCIAAGWGILTKSFGVRFSTASAVKTDTSGIRVMTYNVHDFKRFGFNNDVSTKDEILNIINSIQPDIIGFQEFYSRTHGQYDMVDTIQQVLHSNQYYFEASQANSYEGIGMAVFSKYPIVAHGIVPFNNDPASEKQCIYVDVKKAGKIIRFYSVHLESVRFDPDDYQYLSEVSGEGKANMQSTKRIGGKLKSAFLKRGRQVEVIKQHAKNCPYPYIISGDFNDTPSSYAVNQMAKGLKNAFTESGSGLGITYNGKFPNYQIDYIMCVPAFSVTGYDIIKKRLSDHYPVYCDLKLNQE